APAAVDDAGLRKLDRFGRDLPDRVAFDDQFMATKQFSDLGIEYFEILEVVDIHGLVSVLSRLVFKCPTPIWRRQIASPEASHVRDRGVSQKGSPPKDPAGFGPPT